MIFPSEREFSFKINNLDKIVFMAILFYVFLIFKQKIRCIMDNWIRTDKQLPPIGKRVLIFISIPSNSISEFHTEIITAYLQDGIFMENQYFGRDLKYVTHWQPLPDKHSECWVKCIDREPSEIEVLIYSERISLRGYNMTTARYFKDDEQGSFYPSNILVPNKNNELTLLEDAYNFDSIDLWTNLPSPPYDYYAAFDIPTLFAENEKLRGRIFNLWRNWEQAEGYEQYLGLLEFLRPLGVKESLIAEILHNKAVLRRFSETGSFF